MISFDTQWKRIVGNDCSGVKYGMSASLGLYWSDQTCALLNGAVTGIRVWGLPTMNWVRGWVLEKESRQWHFKFELLSYMFVYRRLTYTICQLNGIICSTANPSLMYLLLLTKLLPHIFKGMCYDPISPKVLCESFLCQGYAVGVLVSVDLETWRFDLRSIWKKTQP